MTLISKKHRGWIGYNSIAGLNPVGLIHHDFCPLYYCKDLVPILTADTHIQSDIQYTGHRTGILCGACLPNYSVPKGSSECLDCRHIISKLKSFFIFSSLLLAAIVAVMLLMALGVANYN